MYGDVLRSTTYGDVLRSNDVPEHRLRQLSVEKFNSVRTTYGDSLRSTTYGDVLHSTDVLEHHLRQLRILRAYVVRMAMRTHRVYIHLCISTSVKNLNRRVLIN